MVKRVSARARLSSTASNLVVATIVKICNLLAMHRLSASVQLKRTRKFDDWK